MESYVLFSLLLAGLYAGCGVLNMLPLGKVCSGRLIFLAVRTLIIFLVWWGINSLFIPLLSWDSRLIYWEMLLTLFVGAFIFGDYDDYNDYNDYDDYDYYNNYDNYRNYHNDDDVDVAFSPVSFILFVVMLIFIIVCAVKCGKIGSSEVYRDMLPITTKVDSVFEKNIKPTSLEKMRTVNRSVALGQVEQKMGEISGLGSWCEIGKMSLQRINGTFTVTDGKGQKTRLVFDNDFIWAAPLEYRGYWKWRRFKNQGTPGYVLVSATDPSKFYLVTAVNDKPLSIKYLSSAFWAYDLERAVRRAGHIGCGLADNGIQIDGQGHPFNVFAKLEKVTFWGPDKVVSCITVDMQSGEVKEYALNEIPEFIDIVQPESLVYDYLSWAGDLVNGYFNWSQEGEFMPTGLEVIYGDDNCSYYAGIQSVGADRSTFGFILTDVQSGEATLYNISGTTEDAARSAINSNEWVAKFKGAYYADDAVFYNVQGLPTYFAPILMNSGGRAIVKGYGFCYVKNREITGVGATKEEALAAYLRAYALANNRKGISEGSVFDVTEELQILKIRQEGSCYYFKLKGYEDKDFYAFAEILPQVRWMEAEGNPVVKVKFKKTDDRNIPIISIEE